MKPCVSIAQEELGVSRHHSRLQKKDSSNTQSLLNRFGLERKLGAATILAILLVSLVLVVYSPLGVHLISGRTSEFTVTSTLTSAVTINSTSTFVVSSARTSTSAITITSSPVVVANHTEYVTTLVNTEVIGTCSESDYSYPLSSSQTTSTSTVVSDGRTSYTTVTSTITVTESAVERTSGTPYLTRTYTNGSVTGGNTTMTRFENSDEYVVTVCVFTP